MSFAEPEKPTHEPVRSPIVSVTWVDDHRNDPDVLKIDVRARDAYDDGHIPGALHLDLSANRLTSSSPDTIDSWMARLQETIREAGIAEQNRVVFYEDFSGTMAAYGVWLLDAAGLGNGCMLDGGYGAWTRSGHDVSTEPVIPSPTDTTVRFNERVLATAGQIMNDLEREAGNAKRVDARAGMEVSQGAIPDSAHLDWRNHLDGQGTFRPMAELAAIYESFGLEKSDRVTSYCAGGIRAANTYVVLKALGYEHARNYAPSWGEWSALPKAPVE